MSTTAVDELKRRVLELEARIVRVSRECDGWRRLVQDSECAAGMSSQAVVPDSTCLIDWCTEARHELEKLMTTERRLADTRVRHVRMSRECGDWIMLVQNAEKAAGMLSPITDPSSKGLIDWCTTTRREVEKLRLENENMRLMLKKHDTN